MMVSCKLGIGIYGINVKRKMIPGKIASVKL
jgi:hypothetical protein